MRYSFSLHLAVLFGKGKKKKTGWNDNVSPFCRSRSFTILCQVSHKALDHILHILLILIVNRYALKIKKLYLVLYFSRKNKFTMTLYVLSVIYFHFLISNINKFIKYFQNYNFNCFISSVF